MVFHPRYHTLEGQMFRAGLRNHQGKCDGCGEYDVCPDAALDGEPWAPCRWCGVMCEGTRFGDGRILCGMCH